MHTTPLARNLAVAGHLLIWLVILFFAFGPVYDSYSSEVGRTSRTGLEVNGLSVLLPLSIPILLSGIPTAALHFVNRANRWRGLVIWLPVLLLFPFCVLAIWSIGLFCAPSVFLLLAAAIIDARKGAIAGTMDA